MAVDVRALGARQHQQDLCRSGPLVTPAPLPTETIWTAGGLPTHPGRGAEADYQWFSPSKDQNRFNMGLGWSF